MIHKLNDRLFKEKFLDDKNIILHGLDLLISIGSVRIYQIGKTTFEIELGKYHINVYSISAVVKTLKELEPYKTYLINN